MEAYATFGVVPYLQVAASLVVTFNASVPGSIMVPDGSVIATVGETPLSTIVNVAFVTESRRSAPPNEIFVSVVLPFTKVKVKFAVPGASACTLTVASTPLPVKEVFAEVVCEKLILPYDVFTVFTTVFCISVPGVICTPDALLSESSTFTNDRL